MSTAVAEIDDFSSEEELLHLVYAELRRLAARSLAKEPTPQTLDATALVHEAYLRLCHKLRSRWANIRTGTAAAISLPPPPKRCDEFSWKKPGEKPGSSTAESGDALQLAICRIWMRTLVS